MGVGAAILGAGGSLLSGLLGSNAAQKASKQQQQFEQQALQQQMMMFQQTQQNFAPFINLGSGAANKLTGLTDTLTKPFNPTMADLAATPGYQFTLDQGLKSTQNSFAAQGLGLSGAALKGATNYAEGLASTTYQNQFQNYLAQNQQIYNMLSGEVGIGESAAAGQGQLGQQASGNISNLLSAIGAAAAGGTIGSTNALTGALGNIGGAGANAALLFALSKNSNLFGNQQPVTGDYGGGPTG
jgi:hypothetical protein